eukprot:Partr_v1_DN27296_c0_g1_i2_m38626 putative atp-dependent clp protease ATP-binding subunit
MHLRGAQTFNMLYAGNNGGKQASKRAQESEQEGPSSLRDAITLQEHADILEAMLEKSNPRSIRGHLDDYIIGQQKAKESLSCAVFNHYSRVLHNLKRRRESMHAGTFPAPAPTHLLDKSNILILGPSGSGKTLMAKRIAEILQIPFCMNDATTFTQAGYVGDDVEQCVSRLLQASGNNVRKTEIGIIFIDEIDKISKRDVSGNSTSRDVAGEGVQQALLKMLEGTTVHVAEKGRKKNEETVAIDTSNILFILSGAFVGVQRLVDERFKGERSMGFSASTAASGSSQVSVDKAKKTSRKSEMSDVTEVDLINFGLIPEFVGRIPLLVTVDKLTQSELVSILKEPKNSLVEQYTRLFATWSIDLEFTPESLDAIAQRVMHRETGARGLKFVMEEILKQAMYHAPGSEITTIKITGDLQAVFESPSESYLVDYKSGARKAITNTPAVVKPEAEKFMGLGSLSSLFLQPDVK